MTGSKNWAAWWRRFLDISPDGYHEALEILRGRYIEERQHAMRFTQHARGMQYPQFRERLLQVASEEANHAEWIAKEIRQLGGTLPEVPAVLVTEKNSWEYLLADLDEEMRCADEVLEQIQTIQSEFPQVAELLERIRGDGEKHRDAIREMLMKSDPQALWPA
jgi:bacterioferritin (cytochrome b1)